jgi:hypothetical protein
MPQLPRINGRSNRINGRARRPNRTPVSREDVISCGRTGPGGMPRMVNYLME